MPVLLPAPRLHRHCVSGRVRCPYGITAFTTGYLTGVSERAFVFAPDPLLTVTVEAGGEGDEIHLHAGGQGFWVAQMIANLGVDVLLCGPFGGESGRVVRSLVEKGGITVRSIATAGSNGAYVHDRRGGARLTVAETPPDPLGRHELDDLYGASLVAGLE